MLSTFWFGPTGRRMYGAYHEATIRRPSPVALLMCQPMGQEAVRVHRIYRVLAERLARQGMSVLRFDYHATGESPGDDEQGELVGWCDDVLAAQQELLLRSGATHTVWFGARLGAWLAAGASARAGSSAPDALVLWAPITDGANYLSYLAEHSDTEPVVPGRKLSGQAIGFGVSPTLESQLAALDPSAYERSQCARLALAGDGASAELDALSRTLRSRREGVRLVNVPTAVDWVSDEALNAALVPASVIASLEATILAEIA